MDFQSYTNDKKVIIIGLLYGLIAGYLAALLVSVIEPTTNTGINQERWVLLIVAITTTAYLWKKPDVYAAVASGSYISASSMILVLIVYAVLRLFSVESGNWISAPESFTMIYLLLPAAVGMAALGRFFVRKRDEVADS